MMNKAFRGLQQNRCRWDIRCSGMSMNVCWDKINPFVSGQGLLQAASQFSVLQTGWQFSLSAKVSFIRAVALVCQLLAITPSFDLSPACEVPPFVLLVVLGVTFYRCRWDVQCSGMSRMSGETKLSPLSLYRACCMRAGNFLFCRCGGNFLFLLKCHLLGQWCWFVNHWALILLLDLLLPARSLLWFCWWCSASLSLSVGEIFGAMRCPWMTDETKFSHSSLYGACCRWATNLLFYRGVGNFLFLPKSRSLGQCHWFVDCWPLLLPLASLLPVRYLLWFCWWYSASLLVLVRCLVLWDKHACLVKQNYPLRPCTVLVACAGKIWYLCQSLVR